MSKAFISVSLIAILGLLAITTATKVLHKTYKLEGNESFKTYFGGMYDDLRQKSMNSIYCLSYPDFYLVRRLAYALVFVYLRHLANV